MLQCTKDAADTLRFVRESNGVPNQYGFRIFASQADDGRTALRMTFVEQPDVGDQVLEDHGERLFVAGELADSVAGMTLDVTEVPSTAGPSGRELVLRPTGN